MTHPEPSAHAPSATELSASELSASEAASRGSGGKRSKRMRVPAGIGAGAGLLALYLVLFSGAGAVWGKFRPLITGTRAEDGGYVLDSADGAMFTTFAWFVVITCALAAIVAAVVYVTMPLRRGLGALLWCGVLALVGTVAFYVMGSVTAPHIPENPGETVTFAPSFQPGIAGWLAAPFLSVLVYWSAVFVAGTERWS